MVINAQIIGIHDESVYPIQNQSSNPKSKSIFSIYKPTLDKSIMKSKIEFKSDIGKQQVKYPSCLEIWKLNLNKSTLPKKYSKSNQIYFIKNKFKYQSTRKKFSNYFNQSQSSKQI